MPLQKSHFGGSKCFSTAISVQKNLQIAIKHLQIMGDHLAISGGLLRVPLNCLKTRFAGPPGLSGGPGPLGPHCNSTTGRRHQACCLETKTEIWIFRSRDQDRDLGHQVSRPSPRPGQNELECTRVSRPWSRDHNTDFLERRRKRK